MQYLHVYIAIQHAVMSNDVTNIRPFTQILTHMEVMSCMVTKHYISTRKMPPLSLSLYRLERAQNPYCTCVPNDYIWGEFADYTWPHVQYAVLSNSVIRCNIASLLQCTYLIMYMYPHAQPRSDIILLSIIHMYTCIQWLWAKLWTQMHSHLTFNIDY